MKNLAYVFTLLFATRTSFGTDFYDLQVDPYSRSMGLATTAIVDNWTSLYRNPAGLALIEGWELRMPDIIHFAGSSNVLDFVEKLQSLDSGASSTISQQLSQFDREALSAELYLLGMGLYMKRLAVGVHLFNTHMRFRVRTPNPLFMNMKVRLHSDSGLSFGYAHPILNNKLRFGIAFRPILFRLGMDTTFDSNTILELTGGSGLGEFFTENKEVMGLGIGFDADLGVQGELSPVKIGPFGIKPMAGLAFQNIFKSTFSTTVSNAYEGKPPAHQRKMNLGVALRGVDMGVFVPTLSIELRDFFVEDVSMREHFTIASELKFKLQRWFSTAVRAHIARGLWGGGLGVQVATLELEMGTYAESLGPKPGLGVDRLYYASLALSF